MKMTADPLLVAVALGMLNPSVFEVDEDLAGEGNLPPMLEPVEGPLGPDFSMVDEAPAADLSDAVITAEELVRQA